MQAIDSSIDRRTGTATVSIQVIDVQDNVPLFVETSVTAQVNENANIGTVVVSLTVSLSFFTVSLFSCITWCLVSYSIIIIEYDFYRQILS